MTGQPKRGRRRALPEIEGSTKVEHGVGPAREEQETLPARRQGPPVLTSQSLVELMEALPIPHEPHSPEPVLSSQERSEFALAVKTLQAADAMFWVRGRMLLLVRDSRLYREDFETFEDFCQATFDRSARRINMLIEVAPLAEHLMPIMGKKFPMITLNEAQVRALLPVAERHGNEAAEHVLVTIIGLQQAAGRGKLTETLLKRAVATLPQERFDEAEVAQLLEAFLAEPLVLPAPRTPIEPMQAFAAEVARVRSLMKRSAGNVPLAERRKFAVELRALADELESQGET